MNTNKPISEMMYNDCKTSYANLFNQLMSIINNCIEKYEEWDGYIDKKAIKNHCEYGCLNIYADIDHDVKYCEIVNYSVDEEGAISDMEVIVDADGGTEDYDWCNVDLSDPVNSKALRNTLKIMMGYSEDEEMKKKIKEAIDDYESKFDSFTHYFRDLLKTYLDSHEYYEPEDGIILYQCPRGNWGNSASIITIDEVTKRSYDKFMWRVDFNAYWSLEELRYYCSEWEEGLNN